MVNIWSRVSRDWEPDNPLSYHRFALRKRLFMREMLCDTNFRCKTPKVRLPLLFVDTSRQTWLHWQLCSRKLYVYGIIIVGSRWQASVSSFSQACDDFSLVIYDTDWWLCWFVWLRLSRESYWVWFIDYHSECRRDDKKKSNYVASQHIFAVSLAFCNYLSTIWTFLRSFD